MLMIDLQVSTNTIHVQEGGKSNMTEGFVKCFFESEYGIAFRV